MATRVGLFACILVAVTGLLLQSAAAQTTHVVGDTLGWTIPPGGSIAYSTWASTRTFRVGDILEFNFTSGVHDVAQVTKEAFDSCNSSSPIGSVQSTSPVRIILNSTGEHFYICTFIQHCALGQKLAINVTAATAPAPTPSRSPATYVVGDSLGWLVPPGGSIAYSTWASEKTFMVGDTLLFNFTTAQHDVAEVTKTAFDNCDASSTIGPVQSNGPARLSLTSVGQHFYICTFSQHCALGQKLAINVTASTTTATPPPSSTTARTPPSSIASPPSNGPTTAPAPTAGGTTPTPSSAPISLSVAGFSATFLPMAVAFMF
ncbi:PREDICTED: blue copper protein [Nelumbo nucifera]|uniref:Phytocyanin domain-containing protein n=2 Tax=Nelumbo nucifera TaxID=4432 RepID=A0A822YCD6_NELNU|nr:PREDICTED: blue copper protein [Nelumbo nucifera]DAD27188.1 TPA_asm: hypothetical protein HUJ06_028656 [Nelumbo nucifera]